MQSINWKAVEEKAKGMTSEELRFARLDCLEAGKVAWENEKAGVAVSKNQGYYHDEAGIYFKELESRKGK